MNGFFKTPAGIIILIPIVGLAILFGAGIWFMIGIGMLPVLGLLYAYGLASIVAPFIALLSVLTFIWGKEWQKHIEDHEYHYGKIEVRENGKVIHYKNWFSRKHFIFIGKLIVLFADSCGICYRVFVDPINLEGKIILLIFGHLLAIAPWIIGEVIYAVANRPTSAIRRDAIRQREVVAIREEARQITARSVPDVIPAHMRQELPAPSEQVFLPAPANTGNAPSRKHAQD